MLKNIKTHKEGSPKGRARQWVPTSVFVDCFRGLTSASRREPARIPASSNWQIWMRRYWDRVTKTSCGVLIVGLCNRRPTTMRAAGFSPAATPPRLPRLPPAASRCQQQTALAHSRLQTRAKQVNVFHCRDSLMVLAQVSRVFEMPSFPVFRATGSCDEARLPGRKLPACQVYQNNCALRHDIIETMRLKAKAVEQLQIKLKDKLLLRR